MVIAIGSFSLFAAGLVVAYRIAPHTDPATLVGSFVGPLVFGSLGLLIGAAIAAYSMLMRIEPRWPCVVALRAVQLVPLIFAALFVLKFLR